MQAGTTSLSRIRVSLAEPLCYLVLEPSRALWQKCRGAAGVGVVAGKYRKSLFLFRGDLRIRDNTGLIEASAASEIVVPSFVLDPRQESRNPYFSLNAFQFMIRSLRDLARQEAAERGFLCVFRGRPEAVVERLIAEDDIEAVFVNNDYTPFSRTRDAAIAKVCEERQVAFHCCPDLMLHEPGDILKDDGKPYTIFSHFFRKARSIPVRPVNAARVSNLSNLRIASEQRELIDNELQDQNPLTSVLGGRSRALEVLASLRKFAQYKTEREYRAKSATTRLSAHNKFGTCSIREVYHSVVNQLGGEHQLTVELFWRDFYSHIAYFFPHVFGRSFHPKYDALAWDTAPQKFSAWCAGRTGFPIVDAGMRELNATGFMHNHVRMIVASFLTKDLHIDWRWGERYFAQKLVDYDPAVNNGNWQWCASTGCDAQPYFRIFNPWLQQRRYDPDCSCIKSWIPELRSIVPTRIHSPDKFKDAAIPGYPDALVDHATESKRAKEAYRKVAKGA
jgi:deoxyribodipyrimidine photo-lyase